MDEVHNQGYWAVIPGRVLHDMELTPSAKLLYAEITTLANREGYCWASNRYLGDLFGITDKRAGELISLLGRKGYVSIEVIRNEKNAVTERRIWTDRPPGMALDPPLKNKGRSPEKNGDPPLKNTEENNINLDNTPKAPKGGRRARDKSTPDWQPERFEAFWRAYPRGENKQGAIRAWDKLHANADLLDRMALALKQQMATDDWQRGIGVPYASTWINQQRWTDEIKTPPAAAGDSGGWVEQEVL